MANLVEYNDQSIFVVKEYESWPKTSIVHRARELMDGEDDENIKLPYCLENIETGCMYYMKSMLKSTNMGEVVLAKVVDGSGSPISPMMLSRIRGEISTEDIDISTVDIENHVAIKVYEKKKVLENPQSDIVVTRFVRSMSLNHGVIDSHQASVVDMKQDESIQRVRLHPHVITFTESLRSHPHIMAQVDCCETSTRIYSILEFCKGIELFDYIDRNGALSSEDAKEIFRQLLSVLSFLQQLGIVHRDISMENIFFDPVQRKLTMVIDFGMAVRLAPCPLSENQYPCKPFLFDADQPLVSCAEHYCWVDASLGKQYRKNYGKIQYIAPEIMREEPYFHPMLCEIWSAGIVLFIMLLGFPPFDYATQADERYVMITSHELAALLESWDIQLDPLAIDLLEKLLNPNPSSRLKIEEILLHPWMQQANP